MKLNQKGFGVIEGLLLVIALTLIAGVGIYVVNAKYDKQATSAPPSAKSSEAKKAYLEFPQLGVKVKNTEALSDVTFEEGKSEYSTYADFSNKKVGELFRECVNKNRNAFVDPTADELIKEVKDRAGSITRKDGNYSEATKNLAANSSELLKDFGTFYIQAPSGPPPCYALDDETTDDAYLKELEAVQKKVTEAFKNSEKL